MGEPQGGPNQAAVVMRRFGATSDQRVRTGENLGPPRSSITAERKAGEPDKDRAEDLPKRQLRPDPVSICVRSLAGVAFNWRSRWVLRLSCRELGQERDPGYEWRRTRSSDRARGRLGQLDLPETSTRQRCTTPSKSAKPPSPGGASILPCKSNHSESGERRNAPCSVLGCPRIRPQRA